MLGRLFAGIKGLSHPRNLTPLVSLKALHGIAAYAKEINDKGTGICGRKLQGELQALGSKPYTVEQLITALNNTKHIRGFAASQNVEWTVEEIELLGGISFIVKDWVTCFDDGNWDKPKTYSPGSELKVKIGVVNGILLAGARESDRRHIIGTNGLFNKESYKELLMERLLPVLKAFSEAAGSEGAEVRIPGLGCGVFAGSFELQANVAFDATITEIRRDKVKLGLGNLDIVNARVEKGATHGVGVTILQPSVSGKPLCVVLAGDHVSWVCNAALTGLRWTNDAVVALATDLIRVLFGLQGKYEKDYEHPNKMVDPFRDAKEKKGGPYSNKQAQFRPDGSDAKFGALKLLKDTKLSEYCSPVQVMLPNGTFCSVDEAMKQQPPMPSTNARSATFSGAAVGATVGGLAVVFMVGVMGALVGAVMGGVLGAVMGGVLGAVMGGVLGAAIGCPVAKTWGKLVQKDTSSSRQR